jgi:hypothetical protein
LMEEAIFGDLMEWNLSIRVNENSECGNHLIPAELKESVSKCGVVEDSFFYSFIDRSCV